MTARRWAAAALLLITALMLTALHAPAVRAAPAGHHDVSLRDVKTSSGRLTATVGGVDPSSDRIRLRINGHSVPATTTPVVVGDPRTAMLVLDTSRSMAGARLTKAVSALQEFMAALPSDVAVGLVGFADRATLLVSPTTNHSRIRTALTHIHPGGGSGIYDALGVAMSMSPREQILLLTDGTDTVSKYPLADLLASVRHGEATVDVVGLAGAADKNATAVQRQIANAGRGRSYSVASAAQAAERFHEVRVAASLPADATGDTPVVVTVHGSTGEATASGMVATGHLPTVAAPHGRTGLYVGLGAAFLSLILLVMLVVGGPQDSLGRRRMRELVSRYSSRNARAKKAKSERSGLRETSVAQTALELANRVAARRGLGERLSRKLQVARVSLEPNEWLLACAGIVVIVGLLATLVLHNPLIGLPIGLVAGVFGPQMFLSIKAKRRQAAFSNDLPDALQLMAGGLSSGYSLPQAVDSVVRLGEGPIAEEFGRALARSRLGATIEDSLEDVADRLDSVDFRWVVMAIRIQRQVGGNLSEVLTQVAETIRERAWLRRHVRGLSAEGRLSAYILGALPIVVGAYLFMVRREYMRPLYTKPIGMAMLGGAAVFLVVGALFMRKLVKVEL